MELWNFHSHAFSLLMLHPPFKFSPKPPLLHSPLPGPLCLHLQPGHPSTLCSDLVCGFASVPRVSFSWVSGSQEAASNSALSAPWAFVLTGSSVRAPDPALCILNKCRCLGMCTSLGGRKESKYFSWFSFAMYEISLATHARACMDLDNIMFHKMNKSQENTSCLILYIGDP